MDKEKYYKYSFSIIMAVYNVEKYLEEAIESIIRRNHRRKDGADQPHLIYINPRRLGEHGIGSRRAHGNSRLGAHKDPHQEAHKEEKQKKARGNLYPEQGKCQGIVHHAAEGGGQGNGIPKALARVGPDQLPVVKGEKHPQHIHKGNDGKSHIGGNRHLRALYPVQQKAVQPADKQSQGRAD